MKKIALVMGSSSDMDVVEKGIDFLKLFPVEVEVRILSAHRTPDEASDFARNARKEGFSVIVCFAGMAAHLAGVMASQTILPVIAVPLSGKLSGMDSLLSSVMMPPGVPVATVGIDGVKNACLLALEILGDEEISLLLEKEREKMREDVLRKDKEIAEKYSSKK